MPSETFYCPHCQRQLTKSAAAYVMGEMSQGIVMGNLPPTITCPGCGGAIDTQAMLSGKLDAPPIPVATCVIAAVIALLVGGWLLWRHLDTKAREADPFRMRLYFAQEIEASQSPRPFDALAYYEAAARGLTGGRREEAEERAAALAEQLQREQPGVVHRDVLLSAAAPSLEVQDAAGTWAGTLWLREEADRFDVDFSLPGVEPADGSLLELTVSTTGGAPRREHGASARIRVLSVPRGRDPDLLENGTVTAGPVNGPVHLTLDLLAAPTTVSPSSPGQEAREGTPALRVHLVLRGR